MKRSLHSIKTHATRAAIAVALLAAAAGRADNFPAQSLIIPTQASYQDPCAMVSVYGLVYSVLRANDGLRANAAYASGAWQSPITVHWVYKGTKKSPNRCVPTGTYSLSAGVYSYGNFDVVYNGGSVVSGSPGLTDITWNDGCDLTLSNLSGPPATLVNNSNTASASDGAIVTYDTTNTIGKALAFPNYKSKTVAITSPFNVTALQYAGGAFVISAADAPAFLALVSGAVTTRDTAGNTIDFSAFKASGSTGGTGGHGCSVTTSGSASSGTLRAVFNTSSGGSAYANVHQVNIHRAQVPFNADDSQRMNSSPPRIGLLQSVDHDYADESNTSALTGLTTGDPDQVAAPGDVPCVLNLQCALQPQGKTTCDPFRGVCAKVCASSNDCSSLNPPAGGEVCDLNHTPNLCARPILGQPAGGIKGTQLKDYLRSAGLDYSNAGGCYGYNVGYSGYTAANTLCPNGSSSGQIYDNLDVIDVANNVIAQTVTLPDGSAAPRYSVLWAPHWEGRSWRTALNTQGCDATCLANALTNISSYLSDTTKAHGFLAECASIGFLEGAVDAVEPATYPTNYLAACTPGYSGGVPWNNTSGCNALTQFATPTLGSQSLTCQQGSVAGTCSSSPTSGPPAPIGLVHDAGNANIHLPICSDPTTSNGSTCIHFPNPGSPFAQIGDYKWFTYSGSVSDFGPTSTSAYKPGWLPLAYTVGSLNAATLSTNPRSLSIADNFSFIQRENDSRKAQMVYLGGHNYTPDVAGTRVALNTVLALGTVIDRKESAFIGPTLYSTMLVLPTYFRNNSTGIPASWKTFDPLAGSAWVFPYITGNLRVHTASTVTSSAANSADPYGGSSLLYKATLPAPGSRNVFTYLGGKVSATDAELTGSFKAVYGNGVAQIGWQPVDIDYGSIDPNSPSCLDRYHIGAVTKPNTTSTYPGMVLGASSNGTVCDLQEALELTVTRSDLGSDNGASEDAAIVNKLQLQSSINNAQWLLQMVRGFCYATDTSTTPARPYFNPSVANCDARNPVNVATLGGIVHSQAAVIPASTLIADGPAGTHRPTMIYVGGFDGQLHAFYLPTDGLDSGYTGPATAVSALNPKATSVFKNKFNGAFVPPSGVKELWSFIPPGQLPYLQSNQAIVDSSPAVADVFGDFSGTGLRTWHTVLVASAGGSNREIFALDISNPLAPILLWDIQSSFDRSSLAYAPSALQDDDTGIYSASSGSARAQAFNWQNRCRAADSATCNAANYVLPPTADNCTGPTASQICGRTISSLYNYSHLGASQSVSIGTLRRNNAPVFAAFVGTNEPGGHGIYVFAIDLVNGAKLWEWNNPYDRESYRLTDPDKYSGTANTPPAGVSIVSRSLDDQINSLYVGDDEGSLWELDASDGINNTGYGVTLACTPGACNYPLSQAYGDGTHSAQPISTLSTLFVVRPDIPVAGLFQNYIGQTVLAYGTGGTDAVASINPPTSPSTVSVVSGAVHMLPLSPALRDSALDLKNESPSTTKHTHAATWGVAYELGRNKDGTGTSFFPQPLLGGNRIFGSVAADLVTGKLYFGTTTGSVTDINARGAQTGNIYQLDTTVASSASPLSTVVTTGGIGGGLAMSYDSTGQVTLIAATDAGIHTERPTTGGLPASATGKVYSLDGTDTGSQGLLGWILRRSGREY